MIQYQKQKVKKKSENFLIINKIIFTTIVRGETQFGLNIYSNVFYNQFIL